MKNLRQIQKEQTHKHLIETAIHLFAERGFMTVTTADLAKAANVAHGTVFVHFPTLEALLVEVIEEFGARISLRLHELAANQTSLKKVLAAHLEGLTEYESFYTRLVIEGRLLPKNARYVFIMIQSSISLHIGQAAEKEIKEGRLASYSIHLMFNTWMGLVHYYLLNSDLFAPGGSVLTKCGPEILIHFLRLVEAKNVPANGPTRR